MDNGPDELTQLLRAWRKRENSMTQEELAARTGISAGMVGNVERGARLYGPEALAAVAEALHLSDDEIAQLERAQERRRRKRTPAPDRAYVLGFGRGKTEAAYFRDVDMNSDGLSLSEEALEKIREIIREEVRKQQG